VACTVAQSKHGQQSVFPAVAQNTYFVDSTGGCWIGRDEIEKQFEVLFPLYSKKNVTFVARRYLFESLSISACNKTSPFTILASGPLSSEELLWPLCLFPMRYGV
jgi:hypothetical protein